MSTANAFLPETYEVPQAGGAYFKPQNGENCVRILGKQPLIGWLYFNRENKPVRTLMKPSTAPADMNPTDPGNNPQKPKEFWAVTVYDYATGEMGIWEITQTGIKTSIAELSRDSNWGHPKNYDLKITKTGAGLKTEYAVVPVPPKAVSDAVKAAFIARPINLQALLTGGDPFATTGTTPAPQAAPAPAPAPVATPAPAPSAAVPAGDDDLPF
ncbi:hypothetical protein [Hymenobacter cavernae]|uniref:Uncharacterized protein n=1 Tax=Hymenobacter cavernae TaxID=2044852 RepID=A0ABQ1UMQ2_9BACT|nr:hypothetical protein [Hymenobacter cavernae]GGF22478.1 hypothetical protein GCM10011383_37640 [Hymenobacter cavernae]